MGEKILVKISGSTIIYALFYTGKKSKAANNPNAPSLNRIPLPKL